MRPKNIA